MSASLADTTLTLNSTSTIPTVNYPIDFMAWVVLINASPFACHVSLGGYTFTLPAWYYYPAALRDTAGKLLAGIATPFTITPYLQTIPGIGFTSILHTQLYMNGEQPPQMVPTPLGGGPIDLTQAQASSIVNTGNGSGTSIISSTVGGDSATAVSLTNDAKMTLGDSTYKGVLTVAGPSSQIQGDAINNLILESGGLTKAIEFNVNGVQQAFFDRVALNLNNGGLIGAATSLFLNVDQAVNSIIFQVHSVEQARITNTGAQFGTGLNTNTIRDNTNGNSAMDLSAGDGTVKFPKAIVPNVGSSALNGSTSGTATVWQAFTGSALKLVILKLSNFRNGNAGAQTLALPTAFTTGYFFYVGNVSPFNCMSSGVAQNVGIVTTLAAAGGTPTIQTQVNKYSIGDNTNPFDTISFLGSQASAFSGFAFFIGI